MKNFHRRVGVYCSIIFAVGGPHVAKMQASPTNLAPVVNIVWPRGGEGFTHPNSVKIKAQASDPDGAVAEVRFFVETNLVAVATNPPFIGLWVVDPFALPCDFCSLNLRAVAVDNLGAKAESAPVAVHFSVNPPPFTYLEIVSPRNGDILAAPAALLFSVEVLASSGTEWLEFLVDGNAVGSVIDSLNATSPPVSLTVSNVVDGQHNLSVRDRLNGYCRCGPPVSIRVVNLGLRSPIVGLSGHLQFEVVTSLTNKANVIESSSDLQDWSPINTNHPSSNTFTFVESSPATNSHRFYRVVVPPE